MANTKKLTREERKSNKRTARLELKTLYRNLSDKQRTEFKKEKKGIKQFVQEIQKAATSAEKTE